MNDIIEKALQAIELAKANGKIKKGTNEVTKAIERGTAKLVVVAQDVNPPEITMHLPVLAREKKIPFVMVPRKEELGAACGLGISAVSVAVTEPGNASSVIAEIATASQDTSEEKKTENKKEEASEEKKTENKKEEASEEKKTENKKEEASEEKKTENKKEEASEQEATPVDEAKQDNHEEKETKEDEKSTA